MNERKKEKRRNETDNRIERKKDRENKRTIGRKEKGGKLKRNEK